MRLYPSAFIPGARGRRAVALIALLLASVAFLWIILASPEPDHGRVVLQRATLQSAAGERAVLLPHALAVPALLHSSDMLAILPSSLGQHFAEREDIVIAAPPYPVRSRVMQAVWHARADEDPAQVWLRSELA